MNSILAEALVPGSIITITLVVCNGDAGYTGRCAGLRDIQHSWKSANR